MKNKLKRLIIMLAAVLSVFFIQTNASALESDTDSTDEIIDRLYTETGADELIYKLPESARSFLTSMNIDDFTPNSTERLDVSAFFGAVCKMIKSNLYEPMRILLCVIGIVLITAAFDTLKNGSSAASLDNVLSLISTLCIISVLAAPMLGLISELSQTIESSGDFMLVYVPVISVLIITGGQRISGGAFYAVMIYISNVILQIASNIIIPLLKCVLSLSIVASVSDKISLGGFISLFKKAVKWILCFCMSLFVAFITMKSIVSVSEDTISNKVVKFAINNFVPLVGGALSDAYQTVVGCVGVLKSGVGVAAMIAIIAIFLPALIKCAVWQCVVSISAAVCEVFSIKKTCTLLSSLSAVLSCISAILLSIMVIYIVSTAIIIIVGG